jgi:hypothetical protein
MRERSVVRTAATLLGPTYTAAFEKAMRSVGLGDSTSEQRQALARRLATWSPPNEASALAIKPLLADLNSPDVPLDELLPQLLNLREAQSEVLDTIARILAAQPHSLSAANLAGIDAYREPWELELPSEAA